MTGDALARIRLYEGAIPEAWIAPLVAFVTSHPTRSYFWRSRSLPANTLIEQVVDRLAEAGDVHVPWTGAEVWWRAQRTNSTRPFHFDRDERITDHVRSPLVSSILYLSDVGGPTIIVDAEAESIRPPSRAVAVTPRAGRFVTFPGALFHGVMAAEDNPLPRVVVLVNWWAERPLAALDLDADVSSSMVDAAAMSSPAPPTEPTTFDASELFDEPTWRRMLLRAQFQPPKPQTPEK